MSNKKIVLASDQCGFSSTRNPLKKIFDREGYKVEDVGAFEIREGDDYPEYMAKAAVKLPQSRMNLPSQLFFGGSGQGEPWRQTDFGAKAAVLVWRHADILKTVPRAQ